LKIQENIDKILWSFADKMTYVMYGLVTLLQIRAMDPADYGLFSMLLGLHTWIFVISDSFALNNIVQFGTYSEDRKKVNLFSLSLHLIIAITGVAVVFLLKGEFSSLFREIRFYEIGYALPILTLLAIPRTFSIKIIFRERAFKSLFFVNFLFFGLMSILSLYLIFTKKILTFNDMVWVYYAGTGVSAFLALILTFKHLNFGFSGRVSFTKMFKFSIPITLYSSLHSLPRNMDTYIIKLFFPLNVVGVYNSAKTLYRLFEEANNATSGLLYPVAVRQIEYKNYGNVNDVMTKAISFMILATFLLVAILELGLSDFLISTFLPIKYQFAIGHFNLLLIAAMFLPLTLVGSIVTAYGRPNIILKFVVISLIFSLITFILVGVFHAEKLIPLGFVVYITILGSLCFSYVNRNLDFKFVQLFRFFGDSLNYIRKRDKK